MKNRNYLLYLACFVLVAAGCGKKDAELPEPTPVISGLEAEYYVLVRESVTLTPLLENRVDSLVWLVNGQRVANGLQYKFEAPATPATYSVVIMAYNVGNIVQQVVTINTGRYFNFQTNTNAILALQASSKFANKTDVKWEIVSAPSDRYRLTTTGTPAALFATVDKGTYQIRASSGDLVDTLLVTVRTPGRTASPFTAKVFDYLPAPGQFVNELPKYNPGDTYETMVAKAGHELIGEDASMVTLGGWGGYVVIGFDHTIVNVPGLRDFRIYGNAFGANANPRPNAPFGGSCEPGVVMVAYDKNKNGKPDEDEWYEIKGSGNYSADKEPWYSVAVSKGIDVRTFRNYEMTYSRPATETADAAPPPNVSIVNYIEWTDNQGQQGYKVKNTFHAQSYYPGWAKDNKTTYKGIRLARNGMDESGSGSYYVLYAFRYGYVDNYPNSHDNAGIDIDWAIDKDGNKVTLPGIDFVKVYNGIDQDNGWLGEASTEVSKGEDLHLVGTKIATIVP